MFSLAVAFTQVYWGIHFYSLGCPLNGTANKVAAYFAIYKWKNVVTIHYSTQKLVRIRNFLDNSTLLIGLGELFSSLTFLTPDWRFLLCVC